MPSKTSVTRSQKNTAAAIADVSSLAHELAKLISASPAALELIAEALERSPAKKHETCHRCNKSTSAPKTTSATTGTLEAFDPLVSLDIVKRIAGIGKTKIYDLIDQNKFPKAYKPGGTSSRWSLAEVQRWRDEQRPN